MTWQSIVITTTCIFSLLFHIARFMHAPIIPLYAEQLGASPVNVGIIASSFRVAAAALGMPMGCSSDCRDRRSTMPGGWVSESRHRPSWSSLEMWLGSRRPKLRWGGGR